MHNKKNSFSLNYLTSYTWFCPLVNHSTYNAISCDDGYNKNFSMKKKKMYAHFYGDAFNEFGI